MQSKQKILVCGDVEGQFKTLFNRVKAVNDKTGPYDFLFCVGDFFGESEIDWKPYKSGTIPIPVPTYILGPTSEKHLCYYNDINGSEMCPDVNYLGKRGLLTSSGLRIAYLSGIEGPSSTNITFNESDVNAVRDIVGKSYAGSDFLGVDILLTSVWSKDVTRHHTNCPVSQPRINESPLVSRLANDVRPRYHFCGKENIYYERPPYENNVRSDEHNIYCTRFLSLGKVGGKGKWLYAASITPVGQMKAVDLYQVTTDQTPCPYSSNLQEERAKQFFYDMESTSNEMGKRKKKNQNDGKRLKIDQNSCWFCLSNVDAEKHLVISVGDSSYLAMAKGGINEHHVMILPVQHHQCLAHIPDEILAEIKKFKSALRKFFKNIKMVPVIFERNFKTSHLQLHIIPVPKSKIGKLRDAFLSAADEMKIDLTEIPQQSQLSNMVPVDTPYFYLELPSSERFFASCGKSFPLEFARDVLAGEDILDLPHRVNWRDCLAGKAAETKYVQDFRAGFQEFDFTEV